MSTMAGPRITIPQPSALQRAAQEQRVTREWHGLVGLIRWAFYPFRPEVTVYRAGDYRDELRVKLAPGADGCLGIKVPLHECPHLGYGTAADVSLWVAKYVEAAWWAMPRADLPVGVELGEE